MTLPVDREGTWRVEITEYGLFEADSGAVAVSMKCHALEYYDTDTKQWTEWTQYGNYEIEGNIWIFKKKSELNERTAKSLMQNAGWNGDIETIVNGEWQPKQCQVTSELDTYQGNERMRIGFLNHWDHVSGNIGNIDAAKAKQLQKKHGGALRALAGNVTRNETAPTGTPAQPPETTPVDRSPNTEFTEAADDIPFD
jgi:hypothetical protein